MNLDQAAQRVKGEIPSSGYAQLDPMLIAVLVQIIVQVLKYCAEQNEKTVAAIMAGSVGPFWWLWPKYRKARAALRTVVNSKLIVRDYRQHDIEQVYQAVLEALHGSTEDERIALVKDARS